MIINDKKRSSGKFDVVVAGAGLGGLTAANVLAKRGWKVLLVEQHFQLGGLATCFRRKHHIFDVALHGFPVGMKKTLRKYWSKDMAERIIQVPSIRFDNPQFSLDTTFTKNDFMDILVDKFGVDRSVVNAFFAELDGMNYYDDRSMTNRELFEKYFPGRNDVVRLLMEPITYANGSTLDEPAITYGIVFSNFMSKGVYTFLGGTNIMLDMMAEELRGNGVEIWTNAMMGEVRFDNRGRVAAAVIDGHPVDCSAILSNGNILSTICDWVGIDRLSKEFAEKVNTVRINNSSCQVYMGLKSGESIEPMGDLLFTSTHPVFEPKAIISKNITSRTYSIYYPSIRPGSTDYTIVASMNADFADWADLDRDAYKRDKEKLAADTLTDLETRIPGITDKLDHVEVATPKTFKRYTLHDGGASFGTKFEGLDVSMNLPKEIPGLFHAGSVGIIMSGWLGAANYGVIVANNVDAYLDKT